MTSSANAEGANRDRENATAEAEKNFDAFIDPDKLGGMMIEQFLEDHREIRLLKVRLEDKGSEYLKENKEKILTLFDNLESTVTKKIRG